MLQRNNEGENSESKKKKLHNLLCYNNDNKICYCKMVNNNETDILLFIRHMTLQSSKNKIKLFVMIIMRGGRNIKFHYYDRPFFSEHQKCLFSSSQHQN
jgi:hypothetical protein